MEFLNGFLKRLKGKKFQPHIDDDEGSMNNMQAR